MKGLIYRILVITKKQLIYGAVLIGAFIILGMLFGASYRFGNLKIIMLILDPDYSAEDIQKSIEGIADAMVFMVLIGIITVMGQGMTTVTEDYKTKWKSYAHTLPVTPRQTAAATYILLIIEYAVSFVIFLLSAVTINGFFGLSLTMKNIGNYSMTMLGALTVVLILYNIALRFDGEQKAILILLCSVYAVIMVIMVAVAVLNGKIPEHIRQPIVDMLTEAFKMFRKTMFLFPAYSAAVIALCFHRSVKLIERREK